MVNLKAAKIPMQNRREFLTDTFGAGVGFAALSFPMSVRANYDAPQGFHHQDWFMPTTFDLRQDHKAAVDSGKLLVLLWEQEGCTYCNQMHEVAFSYEEIVDVAKANFHIVQMDMRGERPFVDFKGNKSTEGKIAKSMAVTFTPTTQFHDQAGEVYRMPGYANPPVFKAVYDYVVEKGYKDGSFRDWIKKKSGER